VLCSCPYTLHHSSVVMTVFMIGIFDSFFFTVRLSVTSHGEISSRLVFALLFVFLMASLLLIRLELVPFVSSRLSPLVNLLLIEFLLFTELDFGRLVARTGSLLEDCPPGLLPTLERDRVTGAVPAKEVSILLRSLASMTGAGSRLVSGELLGEPVDMGESTAGALAGGTTGSRKGFFDLVGDEKGLERPMVANFWPAKGLLA